MYSRDEEGSVRKKEWWSRVTVGSFWVREIHAFRTAKSASETAVARADGMLLWDSYAFAGRQNVFIKF